MKRILFITTAIAFLALVVTLLPASAGAADVTLAWDANAEPDVDGYRIYYDTDGAGAPYDGTGIDQGDSPIDVPLADLHDASAPIVTFTGLVDGIYRFAATAYDGSGNESGYSNEVAFTVDTRAPSPPENLTAAYDHETMMVSLTWTQDTAVPVDYWMIFYREAGATEWVELDQVQYSASPSLTRALTAVAEGEHKTIEFTVVAFRTSGQNSADAIVASVDIDREPPAPPVLNLVVNVPVE